MTSAGQHASKYEPIESLESIESFESACRRPMTGDRRPLLLVLASCLPFRCSRLPALSAAACCPLFSAPSALSFWLFSVLSALRSRLSALSALVQSDPFQIVGCRFDIFHSACCQPPSLTDDR